jgi:hypothetical protein
MDASMHQLTSLFDAMRDEARIIELVSFRTALIGMVLDDTWPADLVDAVDDLATAISLMRREELARAVCTARVAAELGLHAEPTLAELAATSANDQQLRLGAAALADGVEGLVRVASATARQLEGLVQAKRRGPHLSVVVPGEAQHERLTEMLDTVVPHSLLAFLI